VRTSGDKCINSGGDVRKKKLADALKVAFVGGTNAEEGATLLIGRGSVSPYLHLGSGSRRGPPQCIWKVRFLLGGVGSWLSGKVKKDSQCIRYLANRSVGPGSGEGMGEKVIQPGVKIPTPFG